MSTPPIAALEIGTSRTVVLVGEMDSSRRVTILGKGVASSFGLRKGQVIDSQNARRGVEIAIKQAADQGHVDIGEVLLAVGGGHVRSYANCAIASVASKDRIVTQEDIEEVTENAKSVAVEHDRDIMHTIPQKFSLDGQTGVVNPKGLQGSQLQLRMLIIDAKHSPVENLRNVAIAAKVDVDDIVFNGLCAALSVLSPDQKRNGVLVIDLGGGTTNYLVYADNVIASAGSIAIGGEHVTNDLAVAFNIERTQAEALKIQHGSAIVSPDIGLTRIQLPAGLGREGQSVSLRAFQTVINARMDETLRIVRARLGKDDVLHNLKTGVVFTGGGAAMPGLLQLGTSIFGMPCIVGNPCMNVSGLEDVPDPAAYATAAGLVLYGVKTYHETDVMQSIRDHLGRIFG